jgi:cation diffusion facilitator CzcD-associated flavoprotein CzcO
LLTFLLHFTGIQIIQEVHNMDIKSLTVFQRTPNWTGPLGNESIDPEQMKEIRKRYPKIFEQCANSYAGFVHMPNPKKTTEVDPAERQAYWEKIYARPGFEKWQSNYSDIGFSRYVQTCTTNKLIEALTILQRSQCTGQRVLCQQDS